MTVVTRFGLTGFFLGDRFFFPKKNPGAVRCGLGPQLKTPGVVRCGLVHPPKNPSPVWCPVVTPGRPGPVTGTGLFFGLHQVSPWVSSTV